MDQLKQVVIPVTNRVHPQAEHRATIDNPKRILYKAIRNRKHDTKDWKSLSQTQGEAWKRLERLPRTEMRFQIQHLMIMMTHHRDQVQSDLMHQSLTHHRPADQDRQGTV